MNRKMIVASFMAFLGLVSSAVAGEKEYRYKSGQCVNAEGHLGYNPVESVVVSSPVIKHVDLDFSFAPGEYTYYEQVDAECVDFSGSSGFGTLIQAFPRAWIQQLNLKGSKGLTGFNNFDSPRAMFEGAVLERSISVYSGIAATVDEHTVIGARSGAMACRDIKLKKGIWPDEVVDPNTAFCSTNTW